jgi:hypothetical protein
MRVMSVGLNERNVTEIFKVSGDVNLEIGTLNDGVENAAIQKNWSPFLHNASLLFIQRINPLTVVSVDLGFESGAPSMAKVVSISNYIDLQWRFGVLRGGTNAVQISDTEYLGIFHTVSPIPRRNFMAKQFHTYFMGAYTFSTTPPFRLLRVSPVPIVDKRFYQGPWFARYIDYCVFPSSLFIEGNFAVISLTLQDTDSYMAKIDLHDLLESLVDVEDSAKLHKCKVH